MVKYIYHDKQWSSNYDNSNTYFTGFYGDTQNQTIQESNQNFTWNYDSSILMELSGDGNLDVLNTISASNSIITPTLTAQTINLSNISIAGDIIPQTDAFQSLGTSNLRFKDLCLATHMPGTFLNLQVLTSGSSYTPTTETSKIIAHIVGGGAGGGGCCANEYSAGSGGGAGGLCLASISNIGTGPYVYSIGSAGIAGSSNVESGGNGGNGGDTFITINSNTYVGHGGYGGVYAGSTGYYVYGLGGGSSNGCVSLYGENGKSGIGIATILSSGSGGNSHYGRGGESVNITSNGLDAEGYGAGGSGGANYLTSDGQNGGAGTPGIIFLYEYA
jgi:hypothetical protein